MRLRKRVLGLTVTGFSLMGCVDADVIGTRKFRDQPFQTLFVSEDPLTVLRNSAEADERARVMRTLKEPVKNGASQSEQDEVMQILTTAATSDKHASCRLAAVDALSRFEDPRAEKVLITSWKNLSPDAKPEPTQGVSQAMLIRNALNTGPISPEMTLAIQARALEGLGQRKSPEGLAMLIEISTTPVKKKEPKPELVLLELPTGGEDQNRYELRLAAIRGLGYYRADTKAIQALIAVLQSEKDVAIRGCTQNSLKQATGQTTIPAEAEAWAAWYSQGAKIAEEPSLLQQVGGWFTR